MESAIEIRRPSPAKPAASQPVASHPIVLRLKGLFPKRLAHYEMHERRRGGDLDHVDLDCSHLNLTLIGGPDWLPALKADIAKAREANHREKIAAAQRRGRKADAQRLLEAGPQDPWHPGSQGPLRELILSVNKDWFGGAGHATWDPARVDLFIAHARAFLEDGFGDAVVHARVDLDEEAVHFHAVIAAWEARTTKTSGTQITLKPSTLPLIACYELAQDRAGEHFARIGLRRGERNAEARREAAREGRPLPPKPRHVPPKLWRKREADRVLRERAELRDSAERLDKSWRELDMAQKWQDTLRNENTYNARHLAQERDRLVAARAMLEQQRGDLECERRALADRQAELAARAAEIERERNALRNNRSRAREDAAAAAQAHAEAAKLRAGNEARRNELGEMKARADRKQAELAGQLEEERFLLRSVVRSTRDLFDPICRIAEELAQLAGIPEEPTQPGIRKIESVLTKLEDYLHELREMEMGWDDAPGT